MSAWCLRVTERVHVLVLVCRYTNAVLLPRNGLYIYRVSSILSLNKPEEAEKFIDGFQRIVKYLPYGSTLTIGVTADKANLETQFFRNVFSLKIIEIFTRLMKRGVNIVADNGTSLQILTLEDLFDLASKGLKRSYSERIEVLDGYFSEKGHTRGNYVSQMSQWLQWSFGASHRSPQFEIMRLIKKVGQIYIKEKEFQKAVNSAKRLIAQKGKLFNLDEEEIKFTQNKIDDFAEEIARIAKLGKKIVICQMKGCNKEISEDVSICDKCFEKEMKKRAK